MKDQIIMGKNAEIAIAVPLFRLQSSDEIANLGAFTVSVTTNKPLAYGIDFGSGRVMLLNASVLEKQVKFLGDL